MVVYYYYGSTNYPTERAEFLDSMLESLLEISREEFLYDTNLYAIQISHKEDLYTLTTPKRRLPINSEVVLNFWKN